MRWLDYRALNSPWTSRAELDDAGVQFDVPEEATSVIEALVTAGEGPQLEYKSKIPDTAGERRSTFKTIAAFATGNGGTVVFGVDRDELTVVGLGSEDPKKLRDQLSSMIRSRVIPTPNFEPDVYTLEGKTLLVLRVEPSPSPPYGVTVDESSKERPEFYVRRGASTYPAQPNDVRETTLARPDPETSQPGFLRTLFR
jgi:predicted HTH transcriptional regulator